MGEPGTISWEEFLENAKSFVRVSDEILDSWRVDGDEEIPGQAYLVRKVKTFVHKKFLSGNEFGDVKCSLELNEDDKKDEFEIENDNEDNEVPLITEHHIVWSMSYTVPILYFNGWISDFVGVNPVSVELAQKLSCYGTLKYSELSQAIHPILGTPFLQLHPCLTRELIQTFPMSKNKLVSWLSIIAPVALNLKLKNEYFLLTLNDSSDIDHI